MSETPPAKGVELSLTEIGKEAIKALGRWGIKNPLPFGLLLILGGLIELARERPEIAIATGSWLANSGMFAQLPSGWAVIAVAMLCVAVIRLDHRHQKCEADMQSLRLKLETTRVELGLAREAKEEAQDALSEFFQEQAEKRKQGKQVERRQRNVPVEHDQRSGDDRRGRGR